jgi:hypothetical protein
MLPNKFPVKKDIQKAFQRCKFQVDSGWHNGSDDIVPEKIFKRKLAKVQSTKSLTLFRNDDWVSILSHLIQLPLSSGGIMDFNCFDEFSKQWLKIEERTTCPYTVNRLFRVLVEQIEQYRNLLFNERTSSTAIARIKKAFLQYYRYLIQFHIPSVSFESLVFSVLMMSQTVETVYYDSVEKACVRKKEDYARLPCKTPDEYVSFVSRIKNSIVNK